MAEFGSSICSSVSNPKEGGARPNQSAARTSGGTTACQIHPSSWLCQSPQPCGEVSFQFPPSKAKHQGGKGACPGHTASKWYMDNTAQAFGWQILGLCVGRQRGGVETVANCRAQLLLRGVLEFVPPMATVRECGPRVAPSPETLKQSTNQILKRNLKFSTH